MSSSAARKLDHERKPTKKPNKSLKYEVESFHDRKAVPSLGFPGTMEAAIKQERGSVLYWAKAYRKKGKKRRILMDELIHIGNIGVLEAYARFDPSEGNRFTTYCNGWIRAEIEHSIRRGHPMLTMSAISGYKDYRDGFNAYKNKIDPDTLRKDSRKIFNKLESGKITVEVARKWLRERRIDIRNATCIRSLDEPLFSDGSVRLIDVIVSPYKINETALDYKIIKERIRLHFESALDGNGKRLFRDEKTAEKARFIFERRCFKDEEEDKIPDSAEIAAKFGVSRQSINQIQEKLMKALMPLVLSDPVILEAKSVYLD